MLAESGNHEVRQWNAIHLSNNNYVFFFHSLLPFFTEEKIIYSPFALRQLKWSIDMDYNNFYYWYSMLVWVLGCIFILQYKNILFQLNEKIELNIADKWAVCLNNFSRRKKTGNPQGCFVPSRPGRILLFLVKENRLTLLWLIINFL